MFSVDVPDKHILYTYTVGPDQRTLISRGVWSGLSILVPQ